MTKYGDFWTMLYFCKAYDEPWDASRPINSVTVPMEWVMYPNKDTFEKGILGFYKI